MKEFEYFDVTADVGIIARGKSLDELFVNCARAMFNVMVDITKVKPLKEVEVKAAGVSLEELLLDYLTNLLALKDIHGMFFGDFEVRINEKDLTLTGKARGEESRPEHEVKTEVKAVTYHKMKVEKKNGFWEANFVVDV